MMKLNKYTKSLIVIAIYLLLYYLMLEIHYGTLGYILYVVNTILMIPGMIPAAFFAPNFHLINPTLTVIFNCLIYGLITLKYYKKKEKKIAKEMQKNEVFEKYDNNTENIEQIIKEQK